MTRWWDRSLMVASWALLGLGCLIWWRVQTAPGYAAMESLSAIGIAAAVLLISTLWRARSREIAPLPSSFALATVAPLAMFPVIGSGVTPTWPSDDPIDWSSEPTRLLGLDAIGWNAYAVSWFGLILVMVAIAPFCWELTRRIPAGSGRRVARFGVLACLLGALVVVVISSASFFDWRGSVGAAEYWWILIMVAVLAASAAAAVEATQSGRRSRATSITATLGYVGMGLTVSAAYLVLARAWWPMLGIPIFAIAATAALFGRFAIRPLEAEADVARRERDLVISTLEADRGRFASAIHDGPLADLTLLTLQLDAAGDKENAELVRSVAGELRSLGNELRVPILDDLGAGPAIEWLAQRVSERTDTPIETELQGSGDRPPAAVELAIYRIAQEAIINAAKHGRGPVVVRYDADPSKASLTVMDAGPGISAAAQEQAARAGHLGLMLMARRAEAIGARLEVSPVGGGTLVNVEWGAA